MTDVKPTLTNQVFTDEFREAFVKAVENAGFNPEDFGVTPKEVQRDYYDVTCIEVNGPNDELTLRAARWIEAYLAKRGIKHTYTGNYGTTVRGNIVPGLLKGGTVLLDFNTYYIGE